MISRAEIRAALGNRNVLAMLSVLRSGLGTDGADGYRTVFGGGHFEDVSWHPAKRVTAMVGGRPVVSSAAGAYRITSKVWEGMVDRYGFEDFGPSTQDEAAVALIAIHDALRDVIDGHFGVAIDKIAAEWSFLPGSPYGGPDEQGIDCMDMDSAMAIYHRHGGRLAMEMPSYPAPVQPPAEPQTAKPITGRRTRSHAKSIRPVVVGLVLFGLITWALLAKGAAWARTMIQS